MKVITNAEKMRELLADFYNVANVRTVIFDDDFNRTVAYPEENCSFCGLMKENPESRKLCRESDKKACRKCLETNSLCLHRCHAGLIEVAAPIKMNDITLGYIMFGQVRGQGTDADDIMEYARKYIYNRTALEKAFYELQERSVSQIKSLSNLLEMCASYLWTKELVKLHEGNLIYHLSNYINNVKNDLSVEALCDEFNISRSRLYDIFHKYYGMSIAKYIKKKRTEIAAEYLKKGYRVSEAAEAAGFNDYNYFSKIFKAEYGITPHRYR